MGYLFNNYLPINLANVFMHFMGDCIKCHILEMDNSTKGYAYRLFIGIENPTKFYKRVKMFFVRILVSEIRSFRQDPDRKYLYNSDYITVDVGGFKLSGKSARVYSSRYRYSFSFEFCARTLNDLLFDITNILRLYHEGSYEYSDSMLRTRLYRRVSNKLRDKLFLEELGK